MSPNQLQEIRERCEKATPGPWTHGDLTKSSGPREASLTVSVGTNEKDWFAFRLNEWCNTPDDAAFIANARTDIPALLAHIDGLNDAWKAWSATLRDEIAILKRGGGQYVCGCGRSKKPYCVVCDNDE